MPHQRLGATSSNIGSENPSAVSRPSTSSTETYSLENRQHHSGFIHEQERGYLSIYEPTELSQPVMSDDVSEDRPQHQELCPLLFLNSVWVL